MWEYQKKLQIPVNIKTPDPKLAAFIISQYGGPDGELGASMRYLSQRFSMQDDMAKALLTDVGTEELAHLEIVGSLVHQLTKNLSTSEIERSPMAAYYVDHSKGVFPASAAGNPWKAEYIGVKGDPIADLVEDLAAEQKARVTYDNILKFCDNPDVTQVIKFLRQREVVHFQRFGECLNKIQENVKAKKVQGCGIKDM